MQDNRYPFAPPPLPGDTARPRRRRRSHSRGARPGQPQNQTAGQNQTGPQPRPAAAASANDRAQGPAPQREAGVLGPRRHRRRGSGQNTVQNASPSQRPANAPRTQQPPRGAPAAPPRTEDPGLPLISRRPPKQKFANFEEYIAAHGGVTAPLPGDGAEQAPE